MAARRTPKLPVVRPDSNPAFQNAYRGRPPWDIGRAQPAFVELANEGLIEGSVLDLGCGTGDLVLELTEQGHDAWGIDIIPDAVRQAEAKGRIRGIEAHFLVADALDLAGWGRKFDTLLDCGLFHSLGDADRVRYERNLRKVAHPGTRLHIMVMSDWEEPWGGPRRVSQHELLDTFQAGWRVEDIREARFVTHLPRIRGHAWLASFVRLGNPPTEGAKARKPTQGRKKGQPASSAWASTPITRS